METELDDDIYAEIQQICEAGDDFVSEANYDEALKYYWKAYALIPDPKTNWEATLWILAAIGDTYFITGDYISSIKHLELAMRCPDAIGNPFLHLRLGQCYFETGVLIVPPMN